MPFVLEVVKRSHTVRLTFGLRLLHAHIVLGVLDSGLRHDLTVDEAIALGRRAILAAAHRDAFSGGSINCITLLVYIVDLVYHVTQDGWNFIGNEDVGKLIWETKQREGGFSMIPS
jgi:20S proteasome subunit beta 5